MSRNSSSSLINVRSLVVFLRQYYRVGGGGGSGRTPPSNSPLHRRGYGGCSTPNYYNLMSNPGLRMFSSGNTEENPNPNPHSQNKNEEGNKVVRNPLASSKFNISTWAKWIIGSVVSVIFPCLKGELESVRRIEGQVEGVAEEVEEVAEVVEKVATAVENVMGGVADKLPANTPLKEAVEAVEHASAHVAEDAHYITTFIHQVDEVKGDIENLEKMIGPLVGKVTKDLQISSK